MKPGSSSALLVFSHLRWNFVYQRPQQLLSRLARGRPVMFLEEPVPDSSAWLERETPAPGVIVLRPHVAGSAPGFNEEAMVAIRPMLRDAMDAAGIEDYLLWFYTPMALPLAVGLRPRGVVYDCMDELSAFRFAPPELMQRESELLRLADLVLTGGPSLYAAKRDRHPDVHCFPSSVDAAHFARTPPEHPSQVDLPHPRLGYYGVIDERIDLDLLDAVAEARPQWQVVMVGPLAKIDPESLPRRPNLHWLGQRPYDELPAHLVGWDVCLLPFALNESTRFISPTKTLEYLAAGRPCVSTRIRDVAEPYADVVSIADDAPAFVAACEEILGWPRNAHAAFRERAAAHVAATSWDRTVARIEALLERLELRSEAGQGTAIAASFP